MVERTNLHSKSDPLLLALAQRRHSDAVALHDSERELTYQQLWAVLQHWCDALQALPEKRLALLADNAIDWVLLDLAAMYANKILVPLPPFFSAEQIAGVLKQADVELLFVSAQLSALTSFAAPLAMLEFNRDSRLATIPDTGLSLWSRTGRREQPVDYPPSTGKVTFTSGTSAAPKGVCLSAAQQIKVAVSLAAEVGRASVDRHLCLLPLAVLLENIAGIYVPLLLGAQVLLPRLSELGFSGSSKLDVAALLAALNRWQPQSLLLTPELLKLLVELKRSGQPLPEFRYLALGGGATDAALVQQALQFGLPVHEGYGLSECCSVVALNPYNATRPGSVGKPLPHVQITLSSDGEVLIADNAMLGYLGQSTQLATQIASGDLGYFDDAGYLYITGRKKETIVTGFGRNVSPSWLEARLLAAPQVLQAWVYGGELTPITACLLAPELSDQQLQRWLGEINQSLPDYARFAGWRRINTPLSAASGLLTSQGRLRRHMLQAQLSTLPQHYFGERYELLSDAAVSNG